MVTDSVSTSSAITELPQGRIAFSVAGPAASTAPPVVFVHGVLVDGRLWAPVAERLAAAGIRSYAPTLPLGSHRKPMNAGADLSPAGIAQLVRDFLAALDLSNVTLVGNDTEGATWPRSPAASAPASCSTPPPGSASSPAPCGSCGGRTTGSSAPGLGGS